MESTGNYNGTHITMELYGIMLHEHHAQSFIPHYCSSRWLAFRNRSLVPLPHGASQFDLNKPIQHLSTCFSICFKMFKRDFVLCAKARNFTQPSGPGHVPQCSNLQSEKSASLHVSILGDRKAQILNLTTHGTM